MVLESPKALPPFVEFPKNARGPESGKGNVLPPTPTGQNLAELKAFAVAVLQANTQNVANSTGYIWRSYDMLHRMYLTLFGIGVLAAVVALVKGFQADTGGEATSTFALAGLSAASFFALFLTRPLDSLERNSIFASWVTAATNTYWTRLAYSDNKATIGKDLEDATDDLIKSLTTLAEKHAEALHPGPQSPEPEDSSAPSARKGTKPKKK